MTLHECLKKLELHPSAGMKEVKAAFRKLAFKFHPDLNPDPAAAVRFREINEAYVMAKDHLRANGNPQAGPKTEGKQESKTNPREAAEAYARQQRQQHRRKSQEKPKSSARSRHQKMYYKEEEVLKTILNDPFAKKVFEDIYSQIRKEQPGYKGPLELKRRKLKLHWGERTLNVDFSKGLFGGVKSWFKGQMDHEQTVYFPARHLMPGRKVRITVEQSFSKGPKTIEVTLPKDFVVGRPIRLKGLGRKLGPITGDLLLKILAR